MTVTARRLLIVALLAALFVVAATIPMEQSISGPCRVQSAVTWYVMRAGADQITTGWERNLIGSLQQSLMFQFERPDVITLDFPSGIHEGAKVRRGDTLLCIESREGSSRLQDLEAQRNVASNELQSLLGGARDIDVDVARHDFERAEAELDVAQQEYDRVRALHDSGYVSASELDLKEAQYSAAAAEAERASAAVQALRTASREQEVAVSESRIEQLDAAIGNARDLLGNRQYIFAPVDGMIYMESINPEYLLKLSRQDTLAVYMRIPETAVPYIREADSLTLDLDGIPESLVIPITDIHIEDTEMPTAYAVALLPAGRYDIVSGMSGRASCSLGKKTLLAAARARLGRFAF